MGTVCRGCIHLPTPKHTHEHTTLSGILTKDTLGTPSFLTNTTSWAIPVTDRELQHRKSKNAVLRGEEAHQTLKAARRPAPPQC